MSSKKLVTDLSKTEEERALEVHRKSIVIDGVIVPNMSDDRFDDYLHVYNEAGITAVPASVNHTHNVGHTLKNMSECWRRIERNKDVAVGPVTSAEEVEKAKEDGKTAILFHFHNALCLEPNIYLETMFGFPGYPNEPEFPDWLLETFHRLGVGVVQPIRNLGNLFGSGCFERVDYGLTNYGVDAVKAMNKLGIVIDMSHAGDQSTLDAVEVSEDPVIFSHANAWNLYPGDPIKARNRNKTDEQIKALSEKGGVIGVCLWVALVGEPTKRNLEGYLDHVDHIVNLTGVDHVGFAHDFAPWWTCRPASNKLAWKPHPANIPIPSEEDFPKYPGSFPNAGPPYHILTTADTSSITKGLVARGYSDQEISKILGGNFLRVFRRVFGR